MELNDFDSFVKEQMHGLEVAPSSGVKKALFGKMFFRNLVLFHKTKLIVGACLLGTGSVATYMALNADQGEGQAKIAELNNTENLSTQTQSSEVSLTAVSESDEYSDAYKSADQNAGGDAGAGSFEDNDLTAGTDAGAGMATMSSSFETSSGSADKFSYKSQSSDNGSASAEVAFNSSDAGALKSSSNKTNSFTDVPEAGDIILTKSTNKNTADKDAVVGEMSSNISGETSEEMVEEHVGHVDPIHPDIIDHSTSGALQPRPYKEPYTRSAGNGWSFDIFGGGMNTNIDNYNLDAEYQPYWWDFYKERDFMPSSRFLGGKANYFHNGWKFGAGMSISQIRDYRPAFDYLYDEDALANLGGGALSGVVVYGQDPGTDTALVYYVNPNDQALIDEFNKSYDRYTYVKAPVTLGYELRFKNLSFELNGGLDLNYLIGAGGLRITEGGEDIPTAPLYFYSDMSMTKMAARNQEFKRFVLGWTYEAAMRVHVSPHMDVMLAYNRNASFGSIYKSSHFLDKSFVNSGLKVGITYHLERRMK